MIYIILPALILFTIGCFILKTKVIKNHERYREKLLQFLKDENKRNKNLKKTLIEEEIQEEGRQYYPYVYILINFIILAYIFLQITKINEDQYSQYLNISNQE
jgi:predicted small secreted protein